ncbi:MAG TPA: hypothetical protein VHA82_20230 [Ramlibacter sp.]|uniref:hypothetical protein n=1 Tax=Ramlibacter sp. TaxID=1917967 RepID=UPI002C794544|nr:hypothetical protein [Ramlibacter sp.]HVZ46146.1 hypothetical protein [Ramlibacter sp.]
MKTSLRIPLQVSPEQAARLQALQKAFAEVCNALAPLVQQTRIWNRVTLHHMAYKSLRERFPAVGSQMICNAIYSVSRTARAVFQEPASPFNVQKLQGKPLPLMRFADNSPVYFDRHTLSLRGQEMSLYTLDGRMRFRASAAALAQLDFHDRKLTEIALARGAGGQFELTFRFAPGEAEQTLPPRSKPQRRGAFPEYVQVEQA